MLDVSSNVLHRAENALGPRPCITLYSRNALFCSSKGSFNNIHVI